MKKLLTMICVAMLMLNTTVFSVNAESTPVDTIAVSKESDIMTAGLISSYFLVVSNSNGQLCISGATQALTEMKTVGFIDIQIERSSDGNNWVHVQDIDDVLNSDASSCYISNQKVSVTKGYYYRVTCTHYAKSKGLFAKTQSQFNTSNSIMIS